MDQGHLRWKDREQSRAKHVIYPGHNIRTRSFGQDGRHVIVSRGSNPSIWSGAFSLALGADYVTVNFGLVNDVEPEINGVPISGVTAKGDRVQQPQLILEDGFDAEGRQWVALQVEVDDEGRFAKKPTVVVTKDIRSSGEKIGLHPLGVFTITRELHQVTHFHLKHAWIKSIRRDSGPARHFFWSA